MDESGAALAKEILEQEERVSRLVQQARDVVTVLVKVVKASKIHLPNNPVYVKFREELKDSLDQLFKEGERVSFEVSSFSLGFNGQEVYSNTDMEDNIALMFFEDGVSELCFHRGVTDEELAGFVEVLKFDAAAHEKDDDLVTLMWEKDFQNITYAAAEEEDVEEPGWAEERLAEEADGKERLQMLLRDNACVEQGDAREGYPGGVPGMLDLQALKDGFGAVRGSYSPTDDLALLTELTRIFYDILLTEPDPERFGTVVDSMGRALEIFVGRGDLNLAAVLVVKAQELGHDERLKDRSHTLDTVMDRACSEEVINKVGECVDQGGPGTVDAACAYLRQLDSRAAGPMVGLLETVKDRDARQAICDVLVAQCAGSGQTLLPFLMHRSWYVVRNVVMVLGLVEDPETVPALADALWHPEAKVRREAVHALGQIKGDKAEELLEEALKDSASANRVFAGRLLATLNPERAFGRISGMIGEKGFDHRAFEEQKEFCELMGRSGREKAVPILAERFVKKGFLGLLGHEEIRASAAYGLAAAGGEEALGLLRSESGSKSKLLRDACLGGLRRLDRVQEAEDGA